MLLLQIIQQVTYFVTEIETGAELIDEINKFVPSEIIL